MMHAKVQNIVGASLSRIEGFWTIVATLHQVRRLVDLQFPKAGANQQALNAVGRLLFDYQLHGDKCLVTVQ